MKLAKIKERLACALILVACLISFVGIELCWTDKITTDQLIATANIIKIPAKLGIGLMSKDKKQKK